MFFKNLIYAFRNLWRDKFYSFLNGTGLAIGIAAALLIFLWANDELSFDNFHSKGDRIYRVMANMTFGDEKEMIASAPLPLEAGAKENIPEIERITHIGSLWGTVIKHGEKSFDVKGSNIVHSSFFDIFDFTFLHGDKSTAFDKPTNVVLTKSMAEQIYGTSDVIGQPLTLTNKMDMVVSAVLEDIPTNSHLQFKLLIPFEGNIEKFYKKSARHWGAFNFTSYVLLRPGVEANPVNKKLTSLLPVNEEKEIEDRTSFELQNLSDIYLGSNELSYSRAARGDLKSIRLLSFIGFLILLIACINYVNMSTARSAHRAKATGVRKIIGASRFQLFQQYMLEVLVLVVIAGIIAFGLANLSLGVFEQISGKLFTPEQLLSTSALSIFLGTITLAILLAGIHPALQLSSFKPIQALRGSTFKGVNGKIGLRKILVTSQFACSGILMICTTVMLVQMNYVKKQKLGYDREEIFSFRISDSDAIIFKNELQNQPGVKNVSISSDIISNISSRYGGFDYEGKEPESESYLHRISVDDNFPDFFGLELTEGRWFLPGNRDSSSFILNETAIAKLGITDPIGKWMDFNGRKGKIAGVAKDFHFRSFHHEIEELIFVQNFKWGMKRMNVKTSSKEAALAIASTKKVFSKLESDALFDYSFLDESYDQLYKTESKSSWLLGIFAGLAILISCLGILGLAAYTAERRKKEIGIRKVLGASVSSIVTLLSKDFIKLVVVALLIASPIAWYLMQGWLENFAYSIEIKWWIFALSAFIAVSIALVTISFQSIKAAIANPTKSLKSD